MINLLGRVYRKIKTMVFVFFNPIFKECVLYEVPRVYFKSRVKFGKKVHINDKVFINAVGGVSIGSYSVLSHGVSIISTMNDIERWASKTENEDLHINKEIIIEENVWLCANSTICAGVTIAKNSVVAAGAVVTNSLLESGCLYGGIPAKKIRKL